MAGADCFFVSGLVDTNAIEEIVSEIEMPLNIASWPGLPPAADLGKSGVRRLSSGSGIPETLWKHAAELAKRFLETGDSKLMSEHCMSRAQLQELFSI
jgi:2-methylisocitrate lyase-like PEP mutase family enzyme